MSLFIRRLLAGAALLGAAVTPAIAQGNPVELIPRALFFGNPEKAAGRVSPDGKWISWIAPRDGVLNIWVAPVADLSKAGRSPPRRCGPSASSSGRATAG
jgi:Periplasmic component of the Tol biopolymer transport system